MDLFKLRNKIRSAMNPLITSATHHGIEPGETETTITDIIEIMGYEDGVFTPGSHFEGLKWFLENVKGEEEQNLLHAAFSRGLYQTYKEIKNAAEEKK